MTAFRISNAATVLGTFVADTEEAALDLLAKEAGYKDFADQIEQVGGSAEDLVIEDIDSDIEEAAEQMIDGIIDSVENHNHGYYAQWDGSDADVYLNFGQDTWEYNKRETRLYAISRDDVALDIAMNAVGDWLIGKQREELAAIKSAIRDATDLDALQEALTAADKFAAENSMDREELYTSSLLPSFGGSDINEAGVYSWDAENKLEFNRIREWEQNSR